MQQINLYNPAFERKRELLSLAGLAAIWAGALVLAIAAVAFADVRLKSIQGQLARATQLRESMQSQMTQLTAQVAGRKLNPVLQSRLSELEEDLAGRKQVMATLGNGAIGDTKGFSEYLTAFARQSFDGLWLTGFSLSHSGRDVVLEGRAVNPEAVPGYVRRLNRELIMRGHVFSELEMRRPEAAGTDKVTPAPRFIEFRLATAAPKAAEEAGK